MGFLTHAAEEVADEDDNVAALRRLLDERAELDGLVVLVQDVQIVDGVQIVL